MGSIGRLTPLKGHAVVIDAAALLVERGVEARFIIAGAQAREAPTHLDDLRARAERLGIADRVELISPFDDLAALLSGLDVVVHASVLPDSLPTTVIEAMALGKPVVATALGGVPELIRDAETGFLIPPDDAGRMADAVEEALAAPGAARGRGRGGLRGGDRALRRGGVRGLVRRAHRARRGRIARGRPRVVQVDRRRTAPWVGGALVLRLMVLSQMSR